MKPSRTSQPYRKGARQPGMALTAMLRGRTVGGMNPADITRAAHLVQAGQQQGRKPRPARRPRTQRPAR